MDESKVLFIAKRLNSKEWVYGYYIGNVGDGCYEICDISSSLGTRVDVDPTTLGQYVDREDEKRFKIFTGDICIFYTSTEDIGVIKHKGKVIFKDSKFMFYSDCYYDLAEAFNICVIGNVTDNPELDMEGYVL